MISLEPIAHIRNDRRDLSDDNWGAVTSVIELVESFDPAALDGLEEFSHAEIIYHFHRVDESKINRSVRHPRGNTAWPKVGIFAQRGKDRPNRIGTTMVEIVAHEGRNLTVRGLDAIDGTPVLDIKPVMAEFLPRTPLRQPSWSRALMSGYWSA